MMITALSRELQRIKKSVAEGPLYPSVTVHEIRRHLSAKYDFKRKMSLDAVLADVEEMMQRWQVHVTHPRYLGLFNPNVTLAAVLGDIITAMYNPQLANWRTSPAANEIERYVLSWFAGKVGLPPQTIATFTSGGSEANLTAIVTALTKAFPQYSEDGMQAINERPVMYLSKEAHNGYNKLAHIAGIGRRAIRVVPTDADFKMNVNALKEMVSQDRQNGYAPFIVVGTAGTTGTGAIDPLVNIAAFCRESGLWFHADAAWGGAVVLSPTFKHHVHGLENADSVTCDAHKWLSVPMGGGMFFCRHTNVVEQAFRTEITYMHGQEEGPVFDPLTHSIQWSRRFIGLKLFMALAEYGEAGYAEMIEQQCSLGELLRSLLRASGWTIVNNTPLPLVCFRREGLDISTFLDCARERQVAWVSPVSVGDVTAIRACITNFSTSEEDIRTVVEAMNEIVSQQNTHAIACA